MNKTRQPTNGRTTQNVMYGQNIDIVEKETILNGWRNNAKSLVNNAAIRNRIKTCFNNIFIVSMMYNVKYTYFDLRILCNPSMKFSFLSLQFYLEHLFHTLIPINKSKGRKLKNIQHGLH